MKPPARPVATRPVVFLPNLLFSPRRPGRYALTAAGLSLAGAALLSVIASAAFADLTGPNFQVRGWAFLFDVVVYAPVIETAILAVALEILRRFVRPWVAIAVSAAGWGIAHSSAAPAWGLVIWWPFVVFSLAYLTWRERSLWAAYGMALAIHAAQNAVVAIPNAFP